jgi:hypothetical protein
MSDVDRAYRTLGLNPEAPLEDIGRAYERMTSAWDPDRFVGNAPLEKRAAEKLKGLERAYKILLEAHGIEVDDGPPPSLFDDALAERLSKRRRGFPRWVLVGIAVVVIGAILFLMVGNSEDPAEFESSSLSEDPDTESEAPPESGEPAEALKTAEPTEKQTVKERVPSVQEKPRPAARKPIPLEVAFDLLRAKSATVTKLVDGQFPDLNYLGWKALRADPPEVTLELRAERGPEAQGVSFLWIVNMETERVRAANREAQKLDTPSRPTQRPKLVREN